MHIRRTIVILLLTCLAVTSRSQDTWYGSLAGMHFMYNPAFTGVTARSTMRLSCYSFLPGGNFGLRSIFASFDGYNPSLHGGTGIWISDDMLGEVMNDLRAGASYAYHFRAGRDIYVTAGLTASVIYRGINSNKVTLPSDFDPFAGLVNPPSETVEDPGHTMLDLGTGISIASGSWYTGISVMHLTKPYLSNNRDSFNRLGRVFTVTAGTTFPISTDDLTLNPSASLIVQDGIVTSYLGLNAGTGRIAFGIGGWYISSGMAAAEPSVGINLESLNITLSYSYNISGKFNTLPATAIAKAALSICFNNVEKRKPVHVIKLPEL